jgi:hypothetical protein
LTYAINTYHRTTQTNRETVDVIQLHREIQILKVNPWQKFILETLAGFETPTTNETKSPDTPGPACLPPQSELQPRATHVVDQDFDV